MRHALAKLSDSNVCIMNNPHIKCMHGFLGFGAKDAEGDPQPQMFNLDIPCKSVKHSRNDQIWHSPHGSFARHVFRHRYRLR